MFIKKRKLQIDILTLFLALFLISFAFIITYSYFNNSKTLKEYAESFVNQVNETITEAVNDQFHSAKLLMQTTPAVLKKVGEISINNAELITWLDDVVKFYPNIEGYYFSTFDGSFLEAYKLPSHSGYRNDPSKPLNANIQYALRYIDRGQKEVTETWFYKDKSGDIIEVEKIENITFDPRERPWFVQVKEKNKIFWTDVYLFDEINEPGITASQLLINPHTGEPFGVVGVDISLQNLSSFLSTLAIGKAGKVLIVNRNGKLIVGPEEMETTTLPEPFHTAFKIFSQEGNPNFTFEMVNKKYIASFLSFLTLSEKQWLIEIVVPEKDFLSEVINLNYKVIVISLVIMCVVAILIAFFAKKLSRPIVQLAKEAIKIKEFELEEDIHLKSNIKEIKLMKESLVSMKKALASFGRFVPKKIVQQLLEKSQEIVLGGEKKEVTLFFSDIYHFSQISEKYTAEELMKRLAEYFDPTSQIILSNGGTIDKYIGDGVMAFWGAPEMMTDHASRACIAALLFQAKLDQLNEEWKRNQQPLFLTRIGLHTGEAVIGNIGTQNRMNYTAMGRSVQLAERLEQSNKIYGTRILISEDVAKYLREQFLVRPIDVITIKGKNPFLKIYELLGKKEGDPKIVPSSELVVFCQDFTKAFEVYQSKKWQEALTLFQEIHKKFETDVPTQLYIKRCEENLR